MNYYLLKALWRWVGEAWHVCVGIIITAIAVVVCLALDTRELWIRVFGLALQLGGIATVIWGIRKTRKLFGHPSLMSKVNEWVQSFPPLRRPAGHSISVSTSVAVVKARGFELHGPENPTTEARLAAVERNINAIHGQIIGTQREMDEKILKLNDELIQEAQMRQKGDEANRDKLEEASTGGVYISLFGAYLLFLGVILSTLAPEIYTFRLR